MATIGVLIARIEARMALAAGLDVQVIEEPRLLEMLRHKYNTIFDEVWWLDTMTIETFTLDGTTGLINEDVTNKINRFIDIHSVFYSHDPHPLPTIQIGTNPNLNRHRSVGPYTTDATKMFKVYPITLSEDINVWYRTRLRDEQWEEDNDETEVNMDDELLITGTIYDYLTDDGANDQSAEKFLKMYDKRYKQLVAASFQHGIAKRQDDTGIPEEWR